MSVDLIPASLYQSLYLLLVTIITLVVYNQYKYQDGLYDYELPPTHMSDIMLVAFMSIFIGLRPLSWYYFGDMANYAEYYKTFFEGVPFVFDRNAENLIFDNLFAWWGSERLGYTSFFVLFSTLYFTTSYLGIRKLFPNDSLAAYLVFLAAFSTFSYSTNGIKAGVAASLFTWAMGYRDNSSANG